MITTTWVPGDDRLAVARDSAGRRAPGPTIGTSVQLQTVIRQAGIVAPTNSSVLILGETGTGKGCLAEMIHNMSARRDHPFIKVNCAAIPAGLLESELFGHERGAFTGALTQRLGRFELANGGTLFLDEIGDISAELQPKLLRLVQEHEFERLGSTRTLHTDVRVIAATHRNLRQMVQEGTFRMDLFYRLHVFPITLPPLRERREDIPLLAGHFAQLFARHMNKPTPTIPPALMDSLQKHSWPGNIRELENFIERAVILSQGRLLEAPLHELMLTQQDGPAEPVTLREAERAHILRILREANGIIATAAARLGLPRSTLFYMMRRLGIGTNQSQKCEQKRGAAA
jgi:formate hydrogenlyase transcriptional activator